jgi:fructose-1,6-bisphosphatase/inositol monophosphatase family enzyme
MMTPAELLDTLRRIHAAVCDEILAACEVRSADELAHMPRDGAGDITYTIDHVSETALLDRMDREIAAHDPIILIGEGLPNGRITLPENADHTDARWRIIVDPIDGTRGLMYQKRPGWVLTGVAPNRGEDTSIADIELAVQTEIPLIKQHLCDQLWAIRGQGAQAARHDRLTGESLPLVLGPSTAADLRHGYSTICRFFPGARDVLAALDDKLCYRLYAGGLSPFAESVEQKGTVPLAGPDAIAIFEDQQCTAGQLYGLATGQDRFVADLRPLVQPIITSRGHSLGHCCHPYDLCTKLIAEEVGVIITAPDGRPVRAPLDTDANVAWLGYANRDLQGHIEPVLHELLQSMLKAHLR